MNKTQIKKELGELRDEVFNLRHGKINSNPKVKKAREAYHKVLAEAQKEAEKKCRPLEKKIDKLKAEYQELSRKKEVRVPEKIKNAIEKCMSGVDYGPKGLIVEWVSPSERFAIIVQPGHTYWANMFEPNKYVATERSLMDISSDDGRVGSLGLFDLMQVKTHKGRFPKAVKEEWMAYIEKQEV